MASQTFLTNLQNLYIELVKGSVGKRYLVCLLIFQGTKVCAGISALSFTNEHHLILQISLKSSDPPVLFYCRLLWLKREKELCLPEGKENSVLGGARTQIWAVRAGPIPVTAWWELLSRFTVNKCREGNLPLWMEWGLLLQWFVHREWLQAALPALQWLVWSEMWIFHTAQVVSASADISRLPYLVIFTLLRSQAMG